MKKEDFVEKNKDLQKRLLKELCLIPAPSHHEEKRADYCKKIFESFGAENVYIDSAKNVVFPINCDNSNNILVIEAHTDTVFPDTEPMPYKEENGKIFCPGVGDCTIGVVDVLLLAKYIIENKIVPKKGLLLICNSCEEGLGNLKGTRQIFEDYKGRIEKFVTFDAGYTHIYDNSVGSSRFEVTIKTEGGHSLDDFGNKNAVAEMAKIISEIYDIEVPNDGSHKTTYNVGVMEGGTSVNAIPQSAKMLCEYRSDYIESLSYMSEKFNGIFNRAKKSGIDIEVKIIGERPCPNNLDPKKEQELADICKRVTEPIKGKEILTESASSDCNIPHSLGVPAVAVGVADISKEHTRQEYVSADTLQPGLLSALAVFEALI